VSRRARFLVALAAAMLTAYAALAYVYVQQVLPEEQRFPVSAELLPHALGIYAELTQLDAVRESMQVKISAQPEARLQDFGVAVPEHDLLLNIKDRSNELHVPLKAGEPMQPITYDFDLYGATIADYPFDVYDATLRFSAEQRGGTGAPAALALTMWEDMPPWLIRGESLLPPSNPVKEVRLTIKRTAVERFLAVSLLIVIVVIACAALTIGGMVFLGYRRVEATLTGALGAMVFALPALRHVLPGDPPLGVRADVMIFLWAEIAVVIGLALFVAAWARKGPAP
jgi:hypothetical protein